MKKVLLASTALVLSAGVAAADMTVAGNGRMGIISPFGDDDIGFSSRIRVVFTGSGETSGGLSFGGTIRADNAVGGNAGTAGSVFISGDFGTLTMGDVDGAPRAAVGHVSGVGFTGLSDLNESTFLSSAIDPSMRYDYSFGDFGVHVSADNPIVGTDTAIGAAVSYKGSLFQGGLGFETAGGTDHIIGGIRATFAGATIKANYGTASGTVDGDQWALSLDYGFGATVVTAFYTDDSELGGAEAWGLGAAYDLGGGAKLMGGFVTNETNSTDAFDFGITMTF
jgi:outer membrane protein OmpU